jgi:hypothetical protein
MKLRAAVGALVLLLCWAAITCTRQTPGNPSPNQAQSNQSAENAPPKTAPAPTAAGENQVPANPAQAPASASTPPAVAEATPKPEPPPVVLPAGTVLTARTNTAIGAKSVEAGQTFTAVLAQPISQQGRTVVPAGAPVSGVIVAAKQGGKIKGESNLALQLTSLQVRGVSYPIVTQQYVQQQKGKGGRTAKLGVGGAAGGAVIGGIAGGGKGAAIGSLVGGGAGVAGSAMTGNKELTIPAESVLQFKLAQPVKVNPAPHPEGESNQ